jgi:hypothetical protein
LVNFGCPGNPGLTDYDKKTGLPNRSTPRNAYFEVYDAGVEMAVPSDCGGPTMNLRPLPPFKLEATAIESASDSRMR